MVGLPRLYTEFSEWWPILSAPQDYAEESEFYLQLMQNNASIPLRQVLELGCGGGNNASHLKEELSLTLVDISPGMLAVSQELNPECEHILGDMRTVRLGRQFDAVFIHDAIVYMTTLDDLRQAIETASVHCKPGGVALFAPDCIRETFQPSTDHGGHDGNGRALRYLEWVWDPDPDDTSYTVDFVYLLRDRDGSARCEYDRHICGLFSRQEWLETIRECGFEARSFPFKHSQVEQGSFEVFVGIKLGQ